MNQVPPTSAARAEQDWRWMSIEYPSRCFVFEDIAILIKVIAVDHVSIKITAQTVNVKLELEMESQMH